MTDHVRIIVLQYVSLPIHYECQIAHSIIGHSGLFLRLLQRPDPKRLRILPYHPLLPVPGEPEQLCEELRGRNLLSIRLP